MASRVPATLAVVGVLALTAVAAADFWGVVLYFGYVGDGWVEHGYDQRELITLRFCAEFDGSGTDDGVQAVYARVDAPATASSFDGVFHNARIGDRLTAPYDLRPVGIWENQWDTYVTINATTSPDDTTVLSEGFAEETNDLASSWISDSISWSVAPGDDLGRPDDEGRVLLGQFVLDTDVRSCLEDLDEDGVVGVSDLLILLGAWGPCWGWSDYSE